MLIPETGSTEVGLALGRDGQLTVSHAYVSAVVLLRTSAYETNYA